MTSYLMKQIAFLALALFNIQVSLVFGHGRLIDPPSRASAWRFGFKTPADYTDNQGYCGGATYQHEYVGGKCGICGDPWGGTRHHEAPGGKFATGTITGTYKSGSVLSVTVDITANHFGFFEFKLCPNNNPASDPEQDCFDKFPLKTTTGEREYYMPDQETRPYTVDLMLPRGLQCSQCILQWTYTTANSWGQDEDGHGCVGCGPQETFRACADIRIVGHESMYYTSTIRSSDDAAAGAIDGSIANREGDGEALSPTTEATTDKATAASAKRKPDPTAQIAEHDEKQFKTCKAVGIWLMVPNLDWWCTLNCNHTPSHCPKSHCTCI